MGLEQIAHKTQHFDGASSVGEVDVRLHPVPDRLNLLVAVAAAQQIIEVGNHRRDVVKSEKPKRLAPGISINSSRSRLAALSAASRVAP